MFMFLKKGEKAIIWAKETTAFSLISIPSGRKHTLTACLHRGHCLSPLLLIKHSIWKVCWQMLILRRLKLNKGNTENDMGDTCPRQNICFCFVFGSRHMAHVYSFDFSLSNYAFYNTFVCIAENFSFNFCFFLAIAISWAVLAFYSIFGMSYFYLISFSSFIWLFSVFTSLVVWSIYPSSSSSNYTPVSYCFMLGTL